MCEPLNHVHMCIAVKKRVMFICLDIAMQFAESKTSAVTNLAVVHILVLISFPAEHVFMLLV